MRRFLCPPSHMIRAIAFPLPQRLERQLQVLALLLKNVVERLLFAPAGFGVGQPVAEGIGFAAGAFGEYQAGADGPRPG